MHINSEKRIDKKSYSLSIRYAWAVVVLLGRNSDLTVLELHNDCLRCCKIMHGMPCLNVCLQAHTGKHEKICERGGVFMKKTTIIKVAVILVALIALVVSAVVGKQQSMVDCETCSATGIIHQFDCAECEGAGVDASNAECGACGGAKMLSYADLDGDTTLVNMDAHHEAQCEDCGGTGSVAAGSDYYATFVSLLPPIIAIILALVTKEVYSSLFIGVVIAALFANNFNPVSTMDSVLSVGLIGAVSGTAGIFIFLVVLGILVALINKAGGSAAFGAWAEKNIKSRTGAMIATFILGVLIFIDDYFNCLTVGSVMRPVTDRHKISRAKLAYLIDATAAPICMIAPISSWAAAVSSYAPEGQGISLFIQAIPYNFYSLLTFVFILFICFKKCDFGPMKIHELNAMRTGDLYTSGEKVENTVEEVNNPKARVLDLILPIVVLIVLCVVALIYVGGFFDGETFVSAFAATDATVGLPWGSIIALVITIVYFMLRKLVSFKEAMECIPKGFVAMVPAILILTFATALKNVNGLMGYEVYIENVLGNASSLANLLPAIIFLVACGLSFATGTSWGTFGLLIPIVTAIFDMGDPLMIMGMSACLAGAVCGDHCSPISDTTIMSSAGAQCNHLNHVSTQLPYAITVAVVSFVAYVLAGYIQNWFIVFPIAVVLTIVAIVILSKMSNGEKTQNSKN